jgi:arginase
VLVTIVVVPGPTIGPAEKPPTIEAPSRGAVALIGVPYHLGHRGVSMGRGPVVLLADDAVPRRMRDLGLDVEVTWVDADDPVAGDPFVPGDQMARHLIHNRAVAALVADARAHDRTPVVACGNCNTSIGVTSGLDEEGLGVVWLDAHADAETPEHSADGLFDGMAVAVLAGRCWKAWREQIPGYRPIPEELMVMVGQHDRHADVGWPHAALPPLGRVVDPPVIARDGFEVALTEALDNLATRTDRVYLHVDFDVMEPELATASLYTAAGGLTPAQVTRAIELVHERFSVAAAAFSAYDPDVDPRMLEIATELMVTNAQRGTASMHHRAASTATVEL